MYKKDDMRDLFQTILNFAFILVPTMKFSGTFKTKSKSSVTINISSVIRQNDGSQNGHNK